MAVLTAEAHEQERAKITNANDEETALTKPQWRRLVEAADNFLDANFAAFNATLPAPIRTTATRREKQKAIARAAARRVKERV